jgi:hypothetical protein
LPIPGRPWINSGILGDEFDALPIGNWVLDVPCLLCWIESSPVGFDKLVFREWDIKINALGRHDSLAISNNNKKNASN